ncbi:hypothetical protein [Cryobacterium sp. Y50]|uniref:hypothetical protein n=1 Tax=Cryobacterium sp. Y50 TaxID=2048286 RepID=UPI000CE57B74|nr:hypothetical protein [Cryobacterium sp. Y50]
MPWWSWLLIWSGLTLGSLAVLVWSGLRLYRKSLGALCAFEALADQVAALNVDVSPRPEEFRPAVFMDLAGLRHEVEQREAERVHRRQVRRDGRIVRGKLIGNARYVTR